MAEVIPRRPRRGAGRKPTSCSHCGQRLRYHPVFKAVAASYNFHPIAFRSLTKAYHRPRLAFARQLAAYLLRLEGHTFRAIGAAVHRSEDMAAYSYHRVSQLRSAAVVDDLVRSILQNF